MLSVSLHVSADTSQTENKQFTDSSFSSCAVVPSHQHCLAATDEQLPSLQSHTPVSAAAADYQLCL